MAGPPDLTVDDILSAKPFYYFQDFKVADGNDTKISDIYDFDDADGKEEKIKAKFKDSNDYKFKLFSMEIDNGLVEGGKCTNNQDITITSDISGGDTSNLYKNFFSGPDGGGGANNKLEGVPLNTICGGKKIEFKIKTADPAAAPADEKTHEVTIANTYKENLKTLLATDHNIAADDAYDIINFQDISPANIGEINDALKKDRDAASRYKCAYVHIKDGKKHADKYLTTFYDKNKFTLLGYELKSIDKIYFASCILYLKMNNDLRIVCVENALQIIGFKEGNEELRPLKINQENLLIFKQDEIEKVNNIDLRNTKDKIYDKIEDFSLDMYKTFYIFCGKIKIKNKKEDAAVLHSYVKNENDNAEYKQHIKYPVYSENDGGIENLQHNIIIFDNNLKMADNGAEKHTFADADLFAKEREEIKTRSDLYKFFTDGYASGGCNIGKEEPNMNKIVKTFEYLGYSNGLPMGVDFSLGDDGFNYTRGDAGA